MRSITHSQQNDPDLPRLTDAELLKQLEFLQKEFRWIERTVKAQLQAY
jgi:hypothetical protein